MLQEWHVDYSLVEFGKGWNLIGQLVNKALKIINDILYNVLTEVGSLCIYRIQVQIHNIHYTQQKRI